MLKILTKITNYSEAGLFLSKQNVKRIANQNSLKNIYLSIILHFKR